MIGNIFVDKIRRKNLVVVMESTTKTLSLTLNHYHKDRVRFQSIADVFVPLGQLLDIEPISQGRVFISRHFPPNSVTLHFWRHFLVGLHMY